MKKQNTRRLPAVLLVLALCLGLLAGCGAGDTQQKDDAGNAEQPREEPATAGEPSEAPEEESSAGPETALPDVLPMDFVFASGAGAWSTDLTLNQDGSFTGVYHDADTTTVYICTFSGQFGDIRQVDDHTWSMTLEETFIEEAYPLHRRRAFRHRSRNDVPALRPGDAHRRSLPGISQLVAQLECGRQRHPGLLGSLKCGNGLRVLYL